MRPRVYPRREVGRSGNYLLGGLALVIAVGLGGYAWLPMRTGGPVSDPGPCDAKTTGLAVLLFDFTKPLAGDGVLRSMPDAILRESVLALPAGTQVRIYTLSGQPAVPLAEAGRLCKPPGPGRGDADHLDCTAAPGDDDAPAFCARLADAQRQIAELADAPRELPVPGAPLVEAVDDARLMFAGYPGTGRRSLHIFSDMIQHAAWYSHLAPDGNLRLGPFDDLRVQQDPVPGAASSGADGVSAEVFYVPRIGLTEPSDRRQAHQRLWQQYFASAGMAVVFRDTSAMPRYLAAPPADRVTSLTPVLRQRELLRREQEESARVRALLEAQSAELEEARRSAAADARAAEALAERLLAEETEERRGLAAERAETANLEAELASRRPGTDGAD